MSVAIPLSQQEPLGHKLNADSRATVRFNCGLATSGSKQQYSGRLMVTGMARALDKTALRRKNKSYKDVKVRVAQSCLTVTQWTAQSMEFSRPEHWSG